MRTGPSSTGKHHAPTGRLNSLKGGCRLSSGRLRRALPPPLKLPTFPAWPSEPPDRDYRRLYRGFPEKARKLLAERAKLELRLRPRFREDSTALEGIRGLTDPKAICCGLMNLTLLRHPLPKVLRGSAEYFPDFPARVFLAVIDVPDFASLQVVKKRGVQSEWSPVPLRTESARSKPSSMG